MGIENIYWFYVVAIINMHTLGEKQNLLTTKLKAWKIYLKCFVYINSASRIFAQRHILKSFFTDQKETMISRFTRQNLKDLGVSKINFYSFFWKTTYKIHSNFFSVVSTKELSLTISKMGGKSVDQNDVN